jgi:hypothetical protein
MTESSASSASVSEPITLEDVRRLIVHPGETVVLRVKQRLSAVMVEHLQGTLKAAMPEGVKCLVLQEGAELEVVSTA